MIWLVIIAAVVMLGVLPVGIRAQYDDRGAYLSLSIGPLSTTIYPRPKTEKTRKQKGSKKKSGKSGDSRSSYNDRTKGSLSDFLSVAEFVLEVLSDFRRKLRVNDLQLKLIVAGDDPYEVSVNYGRAWAIIGCLMPQFERFFVIKNRNVDVVCDYLAHTTQARARIHITITVARLLSVVIYHGIRGLLKYYKIIKNIKGGATT